MSSSKIMNRSSYTKFDWKIEDFSKIDCCTGHDSEVFSVGNSLWQTRVCTHGWNSPPGSWVCKLHGGQKQLSIEVFPVTSLSESLNIGVSFAVTSQTDSKNTITKETKNNVFDVIRFDSFIIPFEKFMLLSELHDPANGYIVDDTCIITVEITVQTIEKGSYETDKVVVSGRNTKRRKAVQGYDFNAESTNCSNNQKKFI